MLKDILSVFGGAMGLIFRFILVLGLGAGVFYCAVTMFFCPLLWEGLKRLAIAAACVGGIILVIRSGRDKDDDGPVQNDFRP